MSGVVPDPVGLAYPVAIDQIGGDEIRERDARRVANGEWCVPQRPPDRPPHIDDLEAMAKQLFSFLAHQVADPLRAGFYRIVVVDAGHRLARRPRRAIDAARDAATD